MLGDTLVVFHNLVCGEGDISSRVTLTGDVEGGEAVTVTFEDLFTHVHGEKVQECRSVLCG